MTKFDKPNYNKGPSADKSNNTMDDSNQQSSSTNDCSSEDETGKYSTPGLDLQFMKTLAMIKTKDKRIYSKETAPFDNEQLDNAKKGWEKLNKNKTNESEDEEQGFFSEKIKTQEEIEKEKIEYKQFMINELQKCDTNENTIKNWLEKNLESKENNSKEAFLIDYLMNKKWIYTPNDTLPIKKLIEDDEMTDNEQTLNEDEQATETSTSAPFCQSEICKKKLGKRKRKREAAKQKKQKKILELDAIEESLERLRDLTKNKYIELMDFTSEGIFDFSKHNSRVKGFVNQGDGQYEFKNKFLRNVYKAQKGKETDENITEVATSLQCLIKAHFEKFGVAE